MNTLKALLINNKDTIKGILTILLLVAAVWYISILIVTERTENVTSLIKVQVAEQRALLTSIAETTARNGADQVTESVIRDCSVSERTSFDSLLGRLDAGLSRTELVELERLFGRCGSFYAERKLVMSSRLEREIGVYENYVLQLAELTSERSVGEYQIETWKRLSEQEQALSTEFSKLVDLQDNIISTLLEGKSRDSEEIQAILREVRDTQDRLIIANSQTTTTRTELTNL